MFDLTHIKAIIQNSISVKEQILQDAALLHTIGQAAQAIVAAFKADKKVLFCGNGGSAGDAQHLAAELSGRFYKDREPLYAEALHVNSSYLTAVANDYSYEEVYARMVKAAGRKGDVLVAISTSGNSPNILKALQQARQVGMLTIGMSGKTGGSMKAYCDWLLNVPSTDTPRIQESHIMIGHILCEWIEQSYFSSSTSAE